ncbi:MAG: alpha/beta hydrolase [Egibacteraceae bacterium]
MVDRIERERARLGAAEAAVFAHYGVDASSESLSVDDPPLVTRVVRCGRGAPTVLFHGGGMTATVWTPLLPHLPARSLNLIDLPGCGLADAFDYTCVDLAEHQAAFVGSVLDALGLQRAALVGSSLGGMYALRFTLQQPERVTALSLISAPAFALPGARIPFPMSLSSNRLLGRLMTALAPSPTPRMMRRVLAMIGGKQGLEGVPEALFDALGAAMALAGPTTASLGPESFRWSRPHPHLVVTDQELTNCHVPVQLIWGDTDKVQSPDAGIRAVELLPDGRIEILPGGHGIWFDAPARCGELLTDFLRSVEEEGASPK